MNFYISKNDGTHSLQVSRSRPKSFDKTQYARVYLITYACGTESQEVDTNVGRILDVASVLLHHSGRHCRRRHTSCAYLAVL